MVNGDFLGGFSRGLSRVLQRVLLGGFLLSLVTGHSSPLLAQSSEWNIFRGNPMLHGVTSAKLPKVPKLLWSYATGDNIKASPVVSEGIVVVGSADGKVYALDLAGKLIWEMKTGNSIEASATLLDGMAYVGDLNGTLYAFDLKTGKEKWKYVTLNQISGAPNYYRNGNQTILAVGSYDYYLHGIDARSGKGLWKYESDNFINGAAAITGKRAVFGGCDGFLHLVDVTSGQAGSKIEVATYVASSVAVEGPYAYLGDYDGKFTCIDLVTQKPAWQWSGPEGGQPFIGSPALSKERVVIGSRDRFVYCFEKSTGKLIWKTDTGSRVDASPVITGNDVLIANMRGDLIILKLSTGEKIWMYEIGSPITGNPAVIDGMIILGADDGMVYCFGG